MDQISLFDFIPDGEKYKPIQSNDWKWSFKDYPTNKNGLKVFSCFACGGGSTMGYKLAGCEVLGCCEIDKEMNDVYQTNHHPKHNFLMDIREFNELSNEQIPDDLFDLDILDGSPPCTTFSMAGVREKSWGKKKKFREGQAEQTLDDLSFVFIETVKKLRPKTVIMENVEGLLLGEAFNYVKEIYDKFDSIGYSLNHWLLKGENMGVPQTRHRVFFLAIRKDLNIDARNVDMAFNYEPIPYKRIRSGKGPSLNPETMEYKTLCKAIPGDRTIADIYERLGERVRRYNAALCWDDRVLPTIIAKLFHYRPVEKEKISVEDIISAQTFPQDYNFINFKYDFIAYICGMSVPPLMIKRIVTKLIEQGIYDYKLKR